MTAIVSCTEGLMPMLTPTSARPRLAWPSGKCAANASASRMPLLACAQASHGQFQRVLAAQRGGRVSR
jgi:hypothetical protein